MTIPTVVGASGSTLLASSDATVNSEPSTTGPPLVPVVSLALAPPTPVVEVVPNVVLAALSVALVVAVELLVPVEVGVEVVAEVVPLPDVELPLVDDVVLLAPVLTVPVLPVVATLSVAFEDSASGEPQATPFSSTTKPSSDSVLFVITSYHFLSCRPIEQRVSS